MKIGGIGGRVLHALARPFGILTIALVILAILVIFLGPAVSIGSVRPLAPATIRLALLLFLALIWGFCGLLMTRGDRNIEDRDSAEAERQREQKVAYRRDQSAAEERYALFVQGARQARRRLEGTGLHRTLIGARRSLPRYLVLGSEGSGKTTLLRNAGLSIFDGDSAPAGFLISEEGLFIETDSPFLRPPSASEKAVWQRILGYIRRWRPTQPLNGILLLLDAGNLALMRHDQAEAMGTLIRECLDEIDRRLRARPPVYLVLTKLDLLVGFEEFFDSLNMDQRNSRLGFQVCSPKGADDALTRFSSGFDEVLACFTEQHLRRLQEETDERLRLRAFEFPNQFALLKSRLIPLVEQIAASNRLSNAPLLRGVFFTSALQTGLVRDSLPGVLASSFALKANAVALPGRGALHSRPFFLHGLQQTVLSEAAMAGYPRTTAAARRLRALSVNLLIAFALIGAAALWWMSFSNGRAYTARLFDEIKTARAELAALKDDNPKTPPFEQAAAALNGLATLKHDRPGWGTLGLYSSAPAEAAARIAYGRGLKNLLLPYVLAYARTTLDSPSLDAVSRFELLKYYLMLGGIRPVDPAVASLVAPGFANAMMSAGEDAGLRSHLVALSDIDLGKQPIDQTLVDQARGRIGAVGMAQLAYTLLARQPGAASLQQWRPVDHMGTEGPQVLARVSGSSLWDGVPGIYTREGYESWIAPNSKVVSRQVAADLWVMGQDRPGGASPEQATRIRQGMLELYAVDYIRYWDGLLGDLTIGPTADAGQAAKMISLLTGAPSPVDQLLKAVAGQTDLESGPLAPSSLLASAALTKGASIYSAIPHRVANVEARVSEHFAQFASAVGTGGKGDRDKPKTTQVDAILSAFRPLYADLNLVATGGDVLELGRKPQDTLDALDAMIDKLPDQIRPLFQRIAIRMAAVTGASTRARLADIWNSTVLPECRSVVSGHYPFDPRSQFDASPQDFSDVFGPKGTIATFREGYLKPFIDTSTRPWKWRGNRIGLGLDDSVLSAFEHAADISNVYFGGKDKPNIGFTVTPIDLDGAATASQFEHNGQTDGYDHGPTTPFSVSWPAPPENSEVALSVTPEIAGQKNIILWQGPWALFHLLDTGHEIGPDKNDADNVNLRFIVGRRWVKLRFSAPAARVLVDGDLVRGFQCPELSKNEIAKK
ncbi:MAG TPA: type VI secretion system membrane subunit TssM [Rhizobiaceae bacterium]|nr:type VI secretion system membrane subunit TssM [Rhizobiaceae bacterium]